MEEKKEETAGSVLAEIRDLLKLWLIPPPEAEPAAVIPRPKVTGWEYGVATLTITEMKDIAFYKPRTGWRLNPVCVIVRTVKASKIDVCLNPLDPAKSEIIAPGATVDDGIFIHWFPYGIYTIGTSAGDRRFWVRGQGLTEAGKAEAVILFEEIGK
jgi:hypothetical protein